MQLVELETHLSNNIYQTCSCVTSKDTLFPIINHANAVGPACRTNMNWLSIETCKGEHKLIEGTLKTIVLVQFYYSIWDAIDLFSVKIWICLFGLYLYILLRTWDWWDLFLTHLSSHLVEMNFNFVSLNEVICNQIFQNWMTVKLLIDYSWYCSLSHIFSNFIHPPKLLFLFPTPLPSPPS